ncbi:hypothetical protein, partial [Escherichia coli]|uniref:hypothetical protein n=1 Tax=Escherichia coli TaxID=562 RepID=UPI001B347A97
QSLFHVLLKSCMSLVLPAGRLRSHDMEASSVHAMLAAIDLMIALLSQPAHSSYVDTSKCAASPRCAVVADCHAQPAKQRLDGQTAV